MIRLLWKWMIGDWWVVRVRKFPGDENTFSAYNPRRRTILDTGPSKEAIQRICDKLNGR